MGLSQALEQVFSLFHIYCSASFIKLWVNTSYRLCLLCMPSRLQYLTGKVDNNNNTVFLSSVCVYMHA